jgi:hypothetical protein
LVTLKLFCFCFIASITHPLGSFDTSSSDITTTTDEGYDGSSLTSAATVIHGGCLTLSDHDRIHVFMYVCLSFISFFVLILIH